MNINTKNATPTRGVQAVAMIGNGTKRHPVTVTQWDTDPGMRWNRTAYTIESFLCNCPNCCNGHARHSARIVALGFDTRNCG